MTSVELLRQYPFFHAFDEAALPMVALATVEIQCAPGEVLFECDRPAQALYLLMSGALELWIDATDRNGYRRFVPVGEIRKGEVAGISALVPPYAYTATGQVTAASTLLKIDAQALRDLAESDARLDSALMHIVAQATMRRVHDARTQLLSVRK